MNSEARLCQSAPASIRYVKQREESVKTTIPSENDDCTPKANKNFFDLPAVLPLTSGEGLPYAPINWPCQGDIWSWKVGRRILLNGYFKDRFLYPPLHLQKCKGPKYFYGLEQIMTYIQMEFPGADVNVLLASFSWKVRANNIDSEPRLSEISRKRIRKKNESEEEDENITRTSFPNWPRKEKNGQKQAPDPQRKRITRQSFKRCFPSSTKKSEVITIDLTQETEMGNSSSRDLESITSDSGPNSPSFVTKAMQEDIEADDDTVAYFETNIYKNSKEKMAHMEAEIHLIDDQIALIQSRRAELDDDLRVKIEAKNNLLEKHKSLKDAISSFDAEAKEKEFESSNEDAAK